MKLDSLRKLYVHELKDLYSAENQLLKALPKMAKAATDEKLKAAFNDHLDETKNQVKRLDQIFKDLEFTAGGHKCAAMAGLVHEAEELIGEDADPRVLDAGLIAAAQRVEHYEMAGYGTARAYAEKLGEFAAADLLEATLKEEGATDRKLTRLAERSINVTAMKADA